MSDNPLFDKITAAVNGYIDAFSQGSADMVMDLYADNCTVEDPVGSPLKDGRDAVREFYVASMQSGAKLTLTGPIRVATNEATFSFTARVELGDVVMEIDVIDHMVFDDQGKITAMRAFFGPENMRQVS